MTPVETQRCLLRDWRPSDQDRVLDIYSRWEVARRWAVERRDDGALLGTCILVGLPEPAAGSGFPPGRFEVGWHLHPDAWGHGYATETARAALAWGFGRGLDEVYAVVRPGNERSMNVCRRLGMAALGRTTAYYATESELFRITRAEQA